MSDLNREITVWITKAMTHNQVFAPKPMPVDLYDNNEAVRAARLLEGKAVALSAIHEARAFDGREPFTDEDYAAFSAAHKDLAEGHRILGEELKANRPDALQAISAHGDAMALHNDAARLAEMRLPSQELGERNLMWPHMESNQFRFGRKAPWDTEEKNWRKAHQAFIASQLAAQKTAFDTGVVEKGMDESLADILRHDQDHDDWHASHGDDPCTSEADCAAKRAKYAEVKAEEAANVSKGDTPGHPFRGNQYAQMAGQHMKTGADLRDQAEVALSPENVAWDGEASKAQQRANIAAGNKIAKAGEAHLKAAAAMLDASEKPTAANVNRAISMSAKAEALSPLSLSHAQIADAHADEAKSWAERAQGHAAEGKFALANLAQNAADAHNAAAAAHEAVLDHSEFSRERGAVRGAEYKTEDAGRIYDRAVRADKEAETSWNGGATQKSTEIVQKGDVPGHVFHGNQYVDGTTSIPDNVGHRDFDPNTTLSQIGKMNVLAVSGGKVNSVHDTDGKVVGLELPVSSGYKVRVFLRDDDTYTVQRVHRDSVKGEETGVYADEVGESVYQAGMYKSNPFGGHKPR